MAGTAAAAGLAAAVIVIPQVISDHSAAGRSAAGGSVAAPDTLASPRKNSASAPAAPKAANARAVLLAVAKVAAKEPIGRGEYWYQRERGSALIHNSDEEYYKKLAILSKEYERTKNDPDATSAEIEAAKKTFTRKLIELKQETLPYSASFASTTETWRSLRDGKGREVDNQKPKVTFATPEDEAKWRQAGSPVLEERANEGPTTKEGKPNYILSIGNPSLTWSSIRSLPTDKKGLKAKLLDVYEESSAKEMGESLAQFYWSTSMDLLTAPITPGTRAALYQVLADSASGFKSHTGVVDALGRTGISLETPGTKQDSERGGPVTLRLIFDADSGKLLQSDILEEGVPFPLLQRTFELTGYVDKVGEIPQS
ncbi:hypothetical protein AB0K60_24740 [Thermopolyspora sp. NPDC052614]|uniref:hypothetical protein n=1 Tax=Thermopolyspora sp. NPDC052614 TaxID=3155682 RepID=UPI00343FD85D